ncbi:hypothetical protein [Streptomyces sp. NBC_00199]|uniref:hypothetical protein n=1 Tax=Streptomyces sp. NBC_00199 TaxID=2975678 RepID=UPI00225437CE|nr:hypothetical protein [Streptomyces sp. NBC_00199]MCX5270031.1 hypothetical protein [Streptomyces sp. NBC_00199]
MKIYPGNGFQVYEERRVVVEDWHAELWLDDADSLVRTWRAWSTLGKSAVYGEDTHNVISDARRAISLR